MTEYSATIEFVVTHLLVKSMGKQLYTAKDIIQLPVPEAFVSQNESIQNLRKDAIGKRLI